MQVGWVVQTVGDVDVSNMPLLCRQGACCVLFLARQICCPVCSRNIPLLSMANISIAYKGQILIFCFVAFSVKKTGTHSAVTTFARLLFQKSVAVSCLVSLTQRTGPHKHPIGSRNPLPRSRPLTQKRPQIENCLLSLKLWPQP